MSQEIVKTKTLEETGLSSQEILRAAFDTLYDLQYKIKEGFVIEDLQLVMRLRAPSEVSLEKALDIAASVGVK